MESGLKTKKGNQRFVLLAIVGAAAAVALGIGVAWTATLMSKNDLRTAIQRTAGQNSIKHPLFYPSRLPAGFSSDGGSVTALEGRGIHFTIVSGDKKIFVTEQLRPRLMEEVTKTQEFTTSIGQAYLTDLNGRLAVFLLAPETLVIVTSSKNAEAGVLRQIAEAMAPVK